MGKTKGELSPTMKNVFKLQEYVNSIYQPSDEPFVLTPYLDAKAKLITETKDDLLTIFEQMKKDYDRLRHNAGNSDNPLFGESIPPESWGFNTLPLRVVETWEHYDEIQKIFDDMISPSYNAPTELEDLVAHLSVAYLIFTFCRNMIFTGHLICSLDIAVLKMVKKATLHIAMINNKIGRLPREIALKAGNANQRERTEHHLVELWKELSPEWIEVIVVNGRRKHKIICQNKTYSKNSFCNLLRDKWRERYHSDPPTVQHIGQKLLELKKEEYI